MVAGSVGTGDYRAVTKQIQEWLGHSDFSTTANIYAHLDYSSKLSSAQAMAASLSLGDVS